MAKEKERLGHDDLCFYLILFIWIKGHKSALNSLVRIMICKEINFH